MPEYKYQAQDGKGKIVKGKAEAYDETDLQKRFHDSGLLLLEAKPIVKNMALKPLKKPFMISKAVMLLELSVMMIQILYMLLDVNLLLS